MLKSRQAELPSVPGSLRERAAEFMARALRAFSRRRALRELARLDDRMLRDIGLTRTDIDAADSLSRGADPIAFLAARRPRPQRPRPRPRLRAP